MLFGVALQFGGNTGQYRNLYEVHQEEITEQSQADQPRRPRMKRQRPFHSVTFQQRFPAAYFFENFSRQIFSLEQQADLRFVQRWILEQREQHFRRRMVHQPSKLFASGYERSLPIFVLEVRHDLTLFKHKGVHQRFSRQLCRSLSHGPRQQTDSCLGSDFSHQAVELAIEEGAAVKHSSGFRKKKIRFSQLQFLDDLARLISQILRPGRQERSRRGVAAFRFLCYNPKYFWKNVSRPGTRLIK